MSDTASTEELLDLSIFLDQMTRENLYFRDACNRILAFDFERGYWTAFFHVMVELGVTMNKGLGIEEHFFKILPLYQNYLKKHLRPDNSDEFCALLLLTLQP